MTRYSSQFATQLKSNPSLAPLGHDILGIPFVRGDKGTDCKGYLPVLNAFVLPLEKLYKDLSEDGQELAAVQAEAEKVALAIVEGFIAKVCKKATQTANGECV